MTQDFDTASDGHDTIEQMLPWYLNGTLSEAETGMVEAHLAQCPACRSQLQREEDLAHSVKAMDLARGRAWAAMEQRLAAAKTSPRAWYRRPVPLGWAVSAPLMAASVAVLVMVALPAGQPPVVQSSQAPYVALGAPGGQRAGNIILQFRDTATAAQMRQVIDRADARLVDGPTASGAYLLHVTPAARPDALKQLTASPVVTFAQPIDPADPQ